MDNDRGEDGRCDTVSDSYEKNVNSAEAREAGAAGARAPNFDWGGGNAPQTFVRCNYKMCVVMSNL